MVCLSVLEFTLKIFLSRTHAGRLDSHCFRSSPVRSTFSFSSGKITTSVDALFLGSSEYPGLFVLRFACPVWISYEKMVSAAAAFAIVTCVRARACSLVLPYVMPISLSLVTRWRDTTTVRTMSFCSLLVDKKIGRGKGTYRVCVFSVARHLSHIIGM